MDLPYDTCTPDLSKYIYLDIYTPYVIYEYIYVCMCVCNVCIKSNVM